MIEIKHRLEDNCMHIETAGDPQQQTEEIILGVYGWYRVLATSYPEAAKMAKSAIMSAFATDKTWRMCERDLDNYGIIYEVDEPEDLFGKGEESNG